MNYMFTSIAVHFGKLWLTSISFSSRAMCLFLALIFDKSSCCLSSSDIWSGESSSLPWASRFADCRTTSSSLSSLIRALYWTRSVSYFAICFRCFSTCSSVDLRSISDDAGQGERQIESWTKLRNQVGESSVFVLTQQINLLALFLHLISFELQDS